CPPSFSSRKTSDRASGRSVALTARRAGRLDLADAPVARRLPLESAAVADAQDRRGRELFGLCRRLGLDEDEANDAVQETFLRMWHESLRGVVIIDADAWAFRVVYRLAMDHHRLGRLARSVVDRIGATAPRDDVDP